MDKIMNNDFVEIYENVESSKLTKKDILDLQYNDGSSRYYFIINFLFRGAKSLKNNTDIPVRSSNKASSQINVHHIVPKSIAIEGEKVKEMRGGNSIANLAPILEDENKEISNKLPKKYYEEFARKNAKINDTLRDLLIDHEYMKVMGEDMEKIHLNHF